MLDRELGQMDTVLRRSRAHEGCDRADERLIMSIIDISVQDLLAEGATSRSVLIDVRTPAEFETAHIDGSENLPLDLLLKNSSEVVAAIPDGAILVCQTGVRSQQAAQALLEAGAREVQILAGGVKAYARSGGDLRRGRQVWDMERQVRLGAGVLVATGILGSQFINPKLKWLSFGIGSGLVFAAVSNTCGMAYALGKMPWNTSQVEPSLQSALGEYGSLACARGRRS